MEGPAAYYDLVAGDGVVAPRSAWTYPDPTPGFVAIRDALAVMAARVEACLVDGEPVQAQPGDFYGGWVTPAWSARSRACPARWAGDRGGAFSY